MIINPKGIDRPIQEMQQLFAAHLWGSLSPSKKGYYHRVFANGRRGEAIPEIYTGNGEYNEVLFDDMLSAQLWFDVADSTESLANGQIVQGCGIVVIVNLKDIYPTLAHRAEEESHLSVQKVLSRMPREFELIGITTGLNAFGQYNTDKLKYPNMHPWHVFRFDCKIHYSLTC